MSKSDRSAGAERSPEDRGRGLGQPLSRRQALGRMSAFATAGAVAWVAPEILTAKPAAGAQCSCPPGSGQPQPGSTPPGSDPTGSDPTGSDPTGTGATGTGTGSTGTGTPTGTGSTTGSSPSTAGSTTSGSTPSPVTSASTTTNTSGSGSGSGVSTEPDAVVAADQAASPLAFTGDNLERDADIGAWLVAGGWALHRWASRSPQVAGDAVEATAADPPQTA